MKSLTILLICLFTLNYTYAQKKQFVCTPCGYDCDREVHESAGTCQACGMALIEKSTVTFSELTFEQLCQRLKANPKAVLLDVRSTQEFSGTSQEVPTYGHFKNAINIPVSELENRIGELTKYKDNEIIVYCSHSHRSPRASYLLSTNGFSKVKNVTGGVSVLPANLDCLKNQFVPHAH